MGKQPAAGTKKTKAAIAKAAAAGAKSKKKWSKGKVKEKLNLAVFVDKDCNNQIKNLAKTKLVTVSTVSDKLKVNGSLARRIIRFAHEKKYIRRIDQHHAQYIYTGVEAKWVWVTKICQVQFTSSPVERRGKGVHLWTLIFRIQEEDDEIEFVCGYFHICDLSVTITKKKQ